MRIVGDSDAKYLEHLRAQVRPLLLLTDAEERIALLLFGLVAQSIDRSVDQTLREIVRVATTTINGRKRKLAMDIAEGKPG